MGLATDQDYENYFAVSTKKNSVSEKSAYRSEVLTKLFNNLPASNLSNEEIKELLDGLIPVAEDNNENKKPAELSRWILGHQVFDLLLDGINFKLSELIHLDLNNETSRVADGLRSTAQKFRASTVAFNYASDFSQAAYTEIVRPSMQPPNQPDGFSGRLNIKHREMKENFSGLEKMLKKAYGAKVSSWKPDVHDAWRELLSAKAENLRQHGRVCQKFVPNGQSLLREYLKNQKNLDDEGGFKE